MFPSALTATKSSKPGNCGHVSSQGRVERGAPILLLGTRGQLSRGRLTVTAPRRNDSLGRRLPSRIIQCLQDRVDALPVLNLFGVWLAECPDEGWRGWYTRRTSRTTVVQTRCCPWRVVSEAEQLAQASERGAYESWTQRLTVHHGYCHVHDRGFCPINCCTSLKNVGLDRHYVAAIRIRDAPQELQKHRAHPQFWKR